MSVRKRIFADPLVHFLAGGALLFAASALFQGKSWRAQDEGRVIRVDDAALLKFMQYQSAAFRPDYFRKQLAAMSPKQRQDFVDRYVREEAMVREARAMGLDNVDYVIRQRLMQKMLFLIDDATGSVTAPSEAELRRYFEAHKASYAGSPTLTFTHVFIDNEVPHPEGREAAAQALKAALEARHAGFDDAPAFGDRFPYLQNYVDRAPDFIANQFGPAFARTVSTLQPSTHWQGPFKSDYGWHVVLVTARSAAQEPRFEDVRTQIRDELSEERVNQTRDKAIADLVKHYEVEIAPDPKP